MLNDVMMYIHRVWYSLSCLFARLLVCLFTVLLKRRSIKLWPPCAATEMPFQMFIMFWPTNTPQKNATQMLQPDYFHRFWANDVTFSSDFWQFFEVFDSWKLGKSVTSSLLTFKGSRCLAGATLLGKMPPPSSLAYVMFSAEEHKWSVYPQER